MNTGILWYYITHLKYLKKNIYNIIIKMIYKTFPLGKKELNDIYNKNNNSTDIKQQMNKFCHKWHEKTMIYMTKNKNGAKRQNFAPTGAKFTNRCKM